MAKQMSREKFLEKCIKTHGLKYDYSKTIYSGMHEYITVICSTHGEFQQEANSHQRGFGCQKCANHYTKTQEEFINECTKIHNNKYDYSKVDYKNTSSKIIIICPIHGKFEQNANNHVLGFGCVKCGYDYITSLSRSNLKDEIEKAKIIHNNYYNYDLITKYENCDSPINITCPVHGPFITTFYRHIKNKQGCGLCKRSRGEIKVEKILLSHNINFIPQYKFHDCIGLKWKLPFDFYLPDHNTCIEFQGEQHYEPVNHFGGIEKFNKTLIRDDIKQNYCIKNNIKLIIIPYWDILNINEILKQNLPLSIFQKG